MRRGWRDEPPMGGHRGYSPPRRRYTTPPPEYCIRMRGLPYRATERDIIDVSYNSKIVDRLKNRLE